MSHPAHHERPPNRMREAPYAGMCTGPAHCSANTLHVLSVHADCPLMLAQPAAATA